MEGKAVYQRKIRAQLSKWKKTIDSLTAEIERSGAEERARLDARRAGLRDKQARGEKLLEKLVAAGSNAWEDLQPDVERIWREITRPERPIPRAAGEAGHQRDRDEEIRHMAYHLWLDEGCPHGRDVEHWLQAEDRWSEQESARRPETRRRAEPIQKRKAPGAASRSKRRHLDSPSNGFQ